jgi:hypothetical protein
MIKVKELVVLDEPIVAIYRWIEDHPDVEIISVSHCSFYEREVGYSMIADRRKYSIIIIYKEEEQ